MSAPLVVLAPLWFEARALRPALPRAEIVRTGMGAAKSRRAAEDVARRFPRACAVAVAGVGGALDARLVPGDVVVASEVRGAGAPRVLDAAKPLARALEARGTRVHLGPIVSTERLARGSERSALAATGALAVDMESAWLAALADEHRFAVLRVVSDGPDHELFSARMFAHGIRALRALRAAAPALATWADSLEGEP
jgi:4-hydroxy-3-methylbut-2-en-1-yl diphosphate reductase